MTGKNSFLIFERFLAFLMDVWVERKRLLKLFDLFDFVPVLGLLLESYHDSGPGRPYYSPVSLFKVFMLQRSCARFKRRFVISMLNSVMRKRPAICPASKRSIEVIPNACRATGMLINISMRKVSQSKANKRNL